MKAIEFEAEMGNRKMKVELSMPFGAGHIWFVVIDKYFHGRLYCTNGKWNAWLNGNSFLTSDDILAMGERIEDNLKRAE